MIRYLLPFSLVVPLLAGCATVPPPGRGPLPPSLAAYRITVGSAAYLPASLVASSSKGVTRWDSEAQVWHLQVGRHTVTASPQLPIVLVDGSAERLAQPPLFHEGQFLLPEVLWLKWIARWAIPAAPVPQQAFWRTIVVDAGHGGYDPGAIGRSGLREKAVTLDVALRLRDLLRQKGFQVVMTRGTDRFISLSRRCEIANGEQGDLFVSIHANSSRQRSVSGFEVYYLSEATDDQARALEASENASLPGEVGGSVSENTQAIVWDLLYTEHRAESIEVSRAICWGLARGGIPQNRGVKSARFAVLKGSRMPAVLVEVGFISHPGEEERLRSSSYRQKIAEGICQGILNVDVQQRRV